MKISALVLALMTTMGAFATTEAPKRIVVIGDSLTEGFGVAKDKAWPALLESKLNADGKSYEVVNAGISGSTSASAVSRVNWQLKQKPDFILLALGANDGLRGLPVENMEKNLSAAIQKTKSAGVKVILIGMRVPPNYGKDYEKKFAEAFQNVARQNKVPLVPFLLDKVGGRADLNLSDGIHPNEKGHEVMAETVFKAIKPHL